MGIGTGKEPISDSKVERREGYWVVDGIKIHLYDVLVPSEGLNVVQFAQIAGPVIERVWARGKLPILVGGSGLYLEVLLGKVGVAKVPQNPQLREELAGLPNEGLLSRLRGRLRAGRDY